MDYFSFLQELLTQTIAARSSPSWEENSYGHPWKGNEKPQSSDWCEDDIETENTCVLSENT